MMSFNSQENAGNDEEPSGAHQPSGHTVLRFGESLPLEWRRGKRLMRLRLERAGYSREVVHPPLRENFAATCEAAMLRDGLPLLSQWLPGSVLALQGLLDPVRLSTERATVAATGRGAAELYRPLTMEAVLRSLAMPAGRPGVW